MFNMKKLLLIAFLFAGLALTQKSQAQGIGFYFYPDLNVYYNTNNHQYAYQDRGNWVYRRSLPRRMMVRGHEHIMVYGNNEIWRENDRHRRDWEGRRHDRGRDRGRDRDRRDRGDRH